jgi:tetratricopeptide (TPR) repeat protein
MTNKLNLNEAEAIQLMFLLIDLMEKRDTVKAAVIAGLLDDPDCKDPGRWHLIAQQAILDGNPDLAEARLKKAIEHGGTGPAFFRDLSQTAFLKGDEAQAVHWAQKIIEAAPESPLGYSELAKILASSGRTDDAVAAYHQILGSDRFSGSDKNEVHWRIGTILMNAGRYSEAIPHLEKAFLIEKNDRDEARLWTNIGVCLSRLGRMEEALAAFESALSLESSADTLSNIADSLIRLGRNAEAIKVLKRAAVLNPGDVMINYALGLAYLEEGRYEEGAAASRRTLADDPEMKYQISNPGIGASQNLGVCLRYQGKFEESLACFDRNISLIANTYFSKGVTYLQMNRPKDAVHCLRKALEIKPDDEETLDVLGQALDDAGKHAEAVATLKKAIEIAPNYGLAYYDLGVILAKKKDKRDEALRCFQKALTLPLEDRFSGWPLYSIACLHAVAGRKEEALDFLEQALAKGLRDRDHIDEDKDLDGIRRDPRFTKIMQKYFAA